MYCFVFFEPAGTAKSRQVNPHPSKGGFCYEVVRSLYSAVAAFL